jgi:hypothetical protein
MKPESYDTMTAAQKKRLAQGLAESTRGRWLIGQALYRGAQAMASDQYPEISNIEDMEVLSYMFPVMLPDALPMSTFSDQAREKYRDESHR